MGRVSRYKKVKSCDPYSKQNGGRQSMTDVWGLGDNGRRSKKRSLTATMMRNRKLKRWRGRSKNSDCHGDDDDDDHGGFDLPPQSSRSNKGRRRVGDEFDLNDLVGSLRKERPNKDALLFEGDSNANNTNKTTMMTATTATTCGTAKNAAAKESGTKVTEPSSSSFSSYSSSLPVSLDEETKEARILKIHRGAAGFRHQGSAKDSAAAAATATGGFDSFSDSMKRKEGETKKAFQLRIQEETRRIIRDEHVQSNKNPEKRQRKKDFLDNKKKRRKKSRNQSSEHDDDDKEDCEDDIGGDSFWEVDSSRPDNIGAGAGQKQFITGERAFAARAAVAVRFGEQAERPPEFKMLPRGASRGKQRRDVKRDNQDGNDGGGEYNNNFENGAVGNRSKKQQQQQQQGRQTSVVTDKDIESERKAMEIMRRKVQAQYAVMKARRRQQSVFICRTPWHEHSL